MHAEQAVHTRRGGRTRRAALVRSRRVAKNSRLGFRAPTSITLQGYVTRSARMHRGNSRCGREVASKVTLGARDYDPMSGRWASKDRIRFAAQTTNFFAYASNDPVNRADFTGTTDEEWGNFLGCVGAMVLCRAKCVDPRNDYNGVCASCIATAVVGPCNKPFGFPDDREPENNCPPGYVPGGWLAPTCIPDPNICPNAGFMDECCPGGCPNSCNNSPCDPSNASCR